MKYIHTLLFTVLMYATSINAQNIYTGTWQSQNDNTLFVVSLWQEGNNIYGNYKMVEYINGVEGNIIYKSNKTYSSGFSYLYKIAAPISNSDELLGFVDDNTIDNSLEHYISGDLSIKLIQPVIIGCTNCTIQAMWKVTRSKGLQYGEPIPFNIPTDIILTKVSNTINLD